MWFPAFSISRFHVIGGKVSPPSHQTYARQTTALSIIEVGSPVSHIEAPPENNATGRLVYTNLARSLSYPILSYPIPYRPPLPRPVTSHPILSFFCPYTYHCLTLYYNWSIVIASYNVTLQCFFFHELS